MPHLLYQYYLSKITVFLFNIFKSVIYSCDAKLNFQHFQSLLQSLVSHDPSEIILLSSFGVQKKKKKKKIVLLLISVENVIESSKDSCFFNRNVL